MFGFFTDSDSNMYKLSNVLDGITGENSIFSSEEPYVCNQDVCDNYDANDFLGFMRNADNNYDNYNPGSKIVDLSRIFTGNSSTSNYNNENAVNMIITDLNFFPDENGKKKHKKYIRDLAKQLVKFL